MSEVEKAEIKNRIAVLENKKANATGTKCEVYTRVTGFIRPVSQFTPGKKAEVSMRKMMKPCSCGK